LAVVQRQEILQPTFPRALQDGTPLRGPKERIKGWNVAPRDPLHRPVLERDDQVDAALLDERGERTKADLPVRRVDEHQRQGGRRDRLADKRSGLVAVADEHDGATPWQLASESLIESGGSPRV
jgi:hypothetical protein